MEQKEAPPEPKLKPEVKAFLKFLSGRPKPSAERRREWGKVLDPLREYVKSGKISLDEYGEIILETINYFQSNAETDGLTGLYNRKAFDEFLPKEIKKAERYKYPVSLVILDINKLKELNDADKSHRSGDLAIIHTAEAIKKAIRFTDLPGRYGGDEFYVILPQADEKAAVEVGLRIIEEVDKKPFILGKKLSVSIGIKQWQEELPQILFDKVDKAAYKAKLIKQSLVVASGQE